MLVIIKISSLLSLLHLSTCTIDGISYINDLQRDPQKYKRGEDPCKPLYWFPRSRPDDCDQKPPEMEPRPNLVPLPVPVPAPAPPAPPVPIGVPILPSGPFLPVPGFPVPLPPAMPPMFMPPPAFPVPIPMPYPQFPMPFPYYPPPPPMIGMVPGIPGLTSRDGAINIMPFSDVYADVLEKHRQRVIRKRLENALGDYRKHNNRRSISALMKNSRKHTATFSQESDE